ncbi:NAD-glutamate dehydrogenase [Rhodoplanes sp. Z2-YC6860]|uniref:NAD-glutamate dehydrogenase n=1 Tax=Rhodoplanes sp. Z2-YC6860 TaxID=674703 RepID=UPI00078C9971|nr:NAD-glutamate dehydrogenase [Rhodoplanes sp. Z2-YC6860]AMN38652.1 NAD-specific glutamate dehydrogenase [Rhodoplanes sp. Z2-YC6860]
MTQPVTAEHVNPEERSVRARLGAAGKLLRDGKIDIPDGFAALLFGRAAPEDVVRYDAAELAALAHEAWTFFSARPAGAVKVRFESPDPALGEHLKTVSVIEIINDDMPFLVDSVMSELTDRGLDVRLVAHPIIAAERDKSGKLKNQPAEAKRKNGETRESFIHIHVDRVEDAARHAEIAKALEDILTQVRAAVTDWKPMLARVDGVIQDLKANPPPVPVDDIAEAVQFLEWMVAENFTFLGVGDYIFTGKRGGLAPVKESALGLLRATDVPIFTRGGKAMTATPQLHAFFDEPKTLIVLKANVRSRVHRRVYLDYVGVKRFDTDGNAIGEFRIVGLFTSTAYTRSTRTIPYLRRKVDAVLRRAGFDPESHSGKALVNVLESYPRDELFQIDQDTLYEFALPILQLEERPRVRVLARRDPFDRFVSVLVFAPRDRYDSHVRARIGAYLAEVYNGRVSIYYPSFPEGGLARVHFIIGRDGGETPNPDRETLEKAVGAIVRTWTDALGAALADTQPPGRAQALFARYGGAFSVGYREAYAPAEALHDIALVEGLSAERPLGVEFYHRGHDDDPSIGLKIWNHGRRIPLSERVPVLENMGFKVVDERTFEVHGEPGVWLHDMALERGDGKPAALEPMKRALETCFIMVMRGVAENDGYNALVMAAGLQWRDVALLRTISRFLRQISVPYSQSYMWSTLRKHPGLAARLVELFHARFDPRLQSRDKPQADLAAAIEEGLKAVDVLDEDRIIRRFVNTVQSAIRTNYYQLGPDGLPKSEIAIKFESRKLDSVPRPAPHYEIFVYSPRVEAVHLRFGKVARGGIRWSDRPQDFRTEILGLVKAQQVKNAVIVPVGSKGGYVPKLLPVCGPREAIQAEGTAAYRIFISTLLDITDNLDLKGVVPPDNVVRHDNDDPYLVVAADKGTATFSDIANEISDAHKFWLSDAFASGGSAGYDHKRMGITARGAWESVKRHFREMDVDIGKTPFSAVGVGDMSGDVFGNGMLRETTTKLVAAFDHRDIFIDPNPDPEKSFAERKRLFDLPRSSWQDYDKTLISRGGGVFPRASKEIVLSKEAQQAIGFAKDKATPQEIMSAILKAPVDLLFFGGIGTYVRASSENDEAAGDRVNDPIRITGAQVRAKVIGEGANLGMTQRGRIEAAHHKVRLNTDAIDNSAGVNTSDVEVNIKIALSVPVRDGRLTIEARNALLHAMTDDVASLVLRNNYLQTLALSLAERRGMEDFGFQQRLMQTLETAGELDRVVEFLPDDTELGERSRRSQPLTRPELAVLLAYAKISLYSALLDSEVPDDPYLGRELGRYFPKAIAEKYPDALEKHRLRREIIATQLANSMINRGGPSLVVRIADQTGASPAGIAAAFAAVRDSYGMPELNDEINALDGKIAGQVQLSLYAAVQDLLLDRLVWFLRNADLSKGLAGVVEHHRRGIAALMKTLDAALPKDAAGARDARKKELSDAGVPDDLAARIASLPELAAAPDLLLIAERTGKPMDVIAATFFAAEAFFRIDRVVSAARNITVSDYFDRLALDRALDSIGDAERRLTAAMIETGGTGDDAVKTWVEPRKAEIDRIRGAIHQIASSGLTLSKLAVAASLLGDLAKG